MKETNDNFELLDILGISSKGLEVSDTHDIYREMLKTAIDLRMDYCILNDIKNGKTNCAHEVLLDSSNDGLIMFAEGFRASIFDKDKIINSFKSLVKRIIEKDRSIETENNRTLEPVIDIVVKKTKFDLQTDLNNSRFYEEVMRLRDKYASDARDILSISYIDPSTEIALPYNFDVVENKVFDEDNDLADLKIELTNETANNRHLLSGIHTFQIFSKKYLRVRLDTNSPHDSEAVINCGMSEDKLNKFRKLFNIIKTSAKTYEV